MFGVKTIEEILHVTPLISQKMEQAIDLWDKMYRDEAPWLHEPDKKNPVRVTSLGLPAMIASEKARMALLELTSEITVPTVETEEDNTTNFRSSVTDNAQMENGLEGLAGTNLKNPMDTAPIIRKEKPVGNAERAEYLNKQYEKLKKVIRKQIEYGIAKGGLVIKPYIVVNDSVNEDTGSNTEIEFEFIQADEFYPLAFDASGRITEAAFLQTKAEADAVYRRLEYHKWENNSVKVINKAYRAIEVSTFGINPETGLGKEVPLTDVPEWKDLQEETVIDDVAKPLFAYFRMPEANVVDTTSPLGTSKSKEGFKRKPHNRRMHQIPFYKFKQILSYKAPLYGKTVETVSPFMTSQTDCTTGKKDGTRKNRRFYCKNGTVLDADWNAAVNIAQKSKHPSSFKMPLDGALRTWKAGCKSTTQSYISLPAVTTGAVQAHAIYGVGS